MIGNYEESQHQAIFHHPRLFCTACGFGKGASAGSGSAVQQSALPTPSAALTPAAPPAAAPSPGFDWYQAPVIGGFLSALKQIAGNVLVVAVLSALFGVLLSVLVTNFGKAIHLVGRLLKWLWALVNRRSEDSQFEQAYWIG